MNKFRIGLRSDIEQSLQGGPRAKDYAFFLLGDQALEKKKMDYSQARSFLNELSKLTFDSNYGRHVPVPYNSWQVNIQCTLTHIMCDFLKQRGYESRKIIVLSQHTDKSGQKLPNLHVKTDFAPDMPKGKDPIVTLTYSMAPLIQVEGPSSTVELVLDPSLSSKPLTIKQWIGKMGQDSFERISLDTYKAKLTEEYQKNPENPYPADQTYVFTGPRNMPFLPTSPESIDDLQKEKPIPDQDTAEYYLDMGKEMMSDTTTFPPYNRMARFIREELRNSTIRDDASAERFLYTIATGFVKNADTFHLKSGSGFSYVFPNLSQEFQAYMEKRNVSIPIIERLKRLLSGNFAPSKVDQSAFFDPFVYNIKSTNVFLQPPDLKLANDESQFHQMMKSQFHQMMDSLLLEAIPTIGYRWIKNAFDCYQDIDVMKKCFPEKVVNDFVNGLDRIRQQITDRVLLGESADQVQRFRDLNAGDKQLVARTVEQFKKRIIKDILAISDSIIIEDVRGSKLQDCIAEVKRCLISNYDVLSQKVNNLIDSIDQETRRDEEKDRKEQIEKHLNRLPKSLPTLLDLPRKEWWRLYIDAPPSMTIRQIKDPERLFDEELWPGYQESMIKTLESIAVPKNEYQQKDLDYDGYTELHQLATQSVPTRQQEWMRKPNGMSKDKGQITFCTLPAIPKDAPGRRERQAALKELHNQRINGLPLFSEHPNFDAQRQKWLVKMDGYATGEIFEELLRGDDERALLKSRDEIMNALHITDDPQGIIMGITHTDNGTVSLLPLYPPDKGPKHVQAILKSYSDGKKVPNQTPLNRLREIGATARALLLIHQKYDGMGRTNVFTFVNKCLIEEGFCPTILPNGSGVFGGAKTVDGLVEDMVVGMHDFTETVRRHKLTSTHKSERRLY
jgi:hypothetical protein